MDIQNGGMAIGSIYWLKQVIKNDVSL